MCVCKKVLARLHFQCVCITQYVCVCVTECTSVSVYILISITCIHITNTNSSNIQLMCSRRTQCTTFSYKKKTHFLREKKGEHARGAKADRAAYCAPQ